MAAWLKRQNKPELQELAEKAGMTGHIHNLNKTDLVETLDLHLSAAPASVRNDPAFSSYYESHHRASPATKREPNSSAPRATATPEPPATTTKRPAKRRQTTVGAAEESAEQAVVKAEGAAKKTVAKSKAKTEGVFAKTPDRIRDLAARVPLPSSPQAVTSLIERSSAAFNDRVTCLVERSGLPNATASTRAMLGGVQAITTLFALFEAGALNRALIPFRHAFFLPLPYFDSVSIKFPDLFVLLTSAFWAPVLLWSALALFIPTAAGYLFNISATQGRDRKYRYAVDPVVFNVAKAVGLWVFYVRGWEGRDELVDPRVSGTVDGGVVGGVPAMFVGALIGGGLGVWEGVVRGQR
ncbi:MAG: hypothetical protein Q9159_007296 [Coniocarpon cinnabarinum]